MPLGALQVCADEPLLHTSTGTNVPFAIGRLTATLFAAALQVTSPEVSAQLAAEQLCPEWASGNRPARGDGRSADTHVRWGCDPDAGHPAEADDRLETLSHQERNKDPMAGATPL